MIRGFSEMCQHFRYVDRPAGKEIFEAAAVLRGFRMKRKSRPVHIDLNVLLQSFNTPGNEIAPGSDVVRENFQHVAVRHGHHLFDSVLKRFSWRVDMVMKKVETPGIRQAE